MQPKKTLKRQLLTVMFISILSIVIFLLSSALILYQDAERQNLNLAKETVRQADVFVQTYFSEVETAYNAIGYSNSVCMFLQSQNMIERWKASGNIQEQAKSIQRSNANIKEIVLFRQDTGYFCFLNYVDISFEQLTQTALEVQMQKNSRICMAEFSGAEYLVYYYPVYDIQSADNFQQPAGVIAFVCDIEPIQNLFYQNLDNPLLQVQLLDMTGKVVMRSFDDSDSAGDVLLLENKIGQTEWKLEGYYQPYLLVRQSRGVILILGGVLLLIIMTLMLVSYWIHRLILAPIASLNSQMKEMAFRRNLRVVSTVENEIGDIAFHINEMLEEISRKNHLIFETEWKLHESELLKNQAQLKALQSQINPHFLYNTLQCIRGIAIQHHTPSIPDMTTAMAEIFRYSIRNDRMVPFREEIQALENYLSIVRVRYLGKIQSEVFVPEELLDIPVLKMILQPVVENAIGHGLEPVCGKKWVSVRAKQDQDTLVIYLENNGKAIDQQQLEQLQNALLNQQPIQQSSRTSIGLSNINDRIKLQYGIEYGVWIESPILEDRGVRVTLTFPVDGAS